MSRTHTRIPQYRLHKSSGLAYVRSKALFGHSNQVYLGTYGSEESKREYGKILARLGQPEAPPSPTSRATVQDMVVAFREHARGYYDRRERNHYLAVCRVLIPHYGRSPVNAFGPVALQDVRERMIEIPWSRGYINAQVNRIRRMFKWAAGNEWCSSETYLSLKMLGGLRQGKTRAKETAAVVPVEWPEAARLLPYLQPILRAMVIVQYLTSMRSDELTRMEGSRIDATGDVWIYRPAQHKTKWRGKIKAICLGPRCQVFLRWYMRDGFLWTPELAEQERGRTPKPGLLERYNAHSYYTALGHGFKKAKRAGIQLPSWHPHQLRHTRATITREKYGLEGSVSQTGNTVSATEIYAEQSLALATRIARETG